MKSTNLSILLRKPLQPLLRAISDIVFVRLFNVWQSIGFHITRNHFHEPIPDTRTLPDELWIRHSELVGVDMNEDTQLEFLHKFSVNFKKEYDMISTRRPVAGQYYANNPSFGYVDGDVLYCMVRYFKPKRMIEIGAGYSTYLSAEAILRNEEEGGHRAELIAIDPYPNETLKEGFPGLAKLITSEVERVELAEFTKLRENDILFIDSSHVLRIGNDVQYEYLEILPRLNKGVIVHIHDIFLPWEYPKDWVLKNHWFWNEQYLLQAFLAFNNAFEILWAAQYMHLRHAEKLEEAFGTYYRRHGAGGSFWIRKKA
jgi:hypothetical protein